MSPNQVESERPVTTDIRNEYNHSGALVGFGQVPFQRNANMPEYYTNSFSPSRNPPAGVMDYMWTTGIPGAMSEGNMNTTIGNGNKVQQSAGSGVNRNDLHGNENDITQTTSKGAKRRGVMRRLFGKV